MTDTETPERAQATLTEIRQAIIGAASEPNTAKRGALVYVLGTITEELTWDAEHDGYASYMGAAFALAEGAYAYAVDHDDTALELALTACDLRPASYLSRHFADGDCADCDDFEDARRVYDLLADLA